MLRWAIVFAIIALIAGVFGFTGTEGTAYSLAKIFAGIFLVLAILSFVFGRRAPVV